MIGKLTLLATLALGTALFANERDAPPGLDRAIRELGADEPLLRTAAEERLLRSGAAAFEALRAAVDDDDLEIALRARYLLARIVPPWTEEGDPAELRGVMDEYGQASLSARRELVEKLGREPIPERAVGLLRIVRYETNAGLAALAAAGLVDLARQAPAEWGSLAAELPQASASTPVAWLEAAQVAYLGDAAKSGPDLWAPLAQAAAEESKRRPRDAALGGGTVDDSSYLASLRAAQAAAAVVAHHYLAAARTAADDAAVADALRCLYEIHGDEQAWDAAATRMHEQYGRFDRAEREYRALLDHAEQESPQTFWARYHLGEMLYDQGDGLAGAEVFDEMLAAAAGDEFFAELIEFEMRGGQVENNAPSAIDSLSARGKFFRAKHHLARGETEAAAELLDSALEDDYRDGDVLIALYRLPNASDERMAETRRRIRKAANYFRGRILAGAGFASSAPTYQNQFAWLIGNTEAESEEEMDQAIQWSLESIQFYVDNGLGSQTGGYRDTLAHCYFYGKHDYAAAVEEQRKAAELEPFTRQITDALAIFEAAYEETQPRDSGE